MNSLLLFTLIPAAALAIAIPEPEEQGLQGLFCARSCRFRSNGDYQSCLGCDVYATCSNGVLYDNRPCPKGLVWDNGSKTCQASSSTCTNRVKKTAACERNIFTSDKPDAKLSCPEGRAIQVESAMYGRQSLGACPSKFPHNNRDDCGDVESSTAIASSACDGQQTCSLAPTNRMFGNPCFGTYKYLKVSYSCVFDFEQ